MTRTRTAAIATSALMSIAASLAVSTTVVNSHRSGGLLSAAMLLIVAIAGGGFGYFVGLRRSQKRPPHRLSVRRGAWMLLVPCAIGSLLAFPSILRWPIATLAGFGFAIAMWINVPLVRNSSPTGLSSKANHVPLGIAAAGLALGLVLSFATSRVNLRGSLNEVGRANGIATQDLNRFPNSISLSQAERFANDPRTGFLAGSLGETRNQTITSQFAGSLRLAALFAALSLLCSLFLPRNLLRIKDAA